MPRKSRPATLGPAHELPKGTTLYRAGDVGAAHVWFTPDPRVAASYSTIYGTRTRRYQTNKPLQLVRFDKIWNAKMALVRAKLVEPQALQMASNLDLAQQVCQQGYDGWLVEREEHLTPLPGGGRGIDPYNKLVGPDVMICRRNAKSMRALDGRQRRPRQRR